MGKYGDVVLVSLLLTSSRFHTLFGCFHCYFERRFCQLSYSHKYLFLEGFNITYQQKSVYCSSALIYAEAYSELCQMSKYSAFCKLAFSQNAPSQMFYSVLNTPLQCFQGLLSQILLGHGRWRQKKDARELLGRSRCRGITH